MDRSKRGTRYGPRYFPPIRREPRFTASKALLFLVMLTYFIGLAMGIFLVIYIVTSYPEHAVQAYLGMLTYIGAPVGVTIGFYSWKAKNENVAKIGGAGNNEEE